MEDEDDTNEAPGSPTAKLAGCFGAEGAATTRADVVIDVTTGEHEQHFFSNRHGLFAGRAVERACAQFFKVSLLSLCGSLLVVSGVAAFWIHICLRKNQVSYNLVHIVA